MMFSRFRSKVTPQHEGWLSQCDVVYPLHLLILFLLPSNNLAITMTIAVLRNAFRPIARSFATEARGRSVNGFVGAVGNTPLVSSSWQTHLAFPALLPTYPCPF